MTIKLTRDKATKLKQAVEGILEKEEVSLHHVSKAVGLMVASFPGMQYGQLFYRRCDNHKNKVLIDAAGNYSSKTSLPDDCKRGLR